MEQYLLMIQLGAIVALFGFAIFTMMRSSKENIRLERRINEFGVALNEERQQLTNMNRDRLHDFIGHVQHLMEEQLQQFENKVQKTLLQMEAKHQSFLAQFEAASLERLERMDLDAEVRFHRLEEGILSGFTTLEQEAKASMNQLIDRFGQQLDEEWKKKERKMAEWMDYIDALPAPEERIEALESAMNKYPYAKELVLKYEQEIKPLLHSEQPLVKKRGLERWNKVTRVFLDHCDVEDYELAINMYSDVIEQGRQFMESSYQKRVEMAKQQLRLMNEKLKEIEQWDEWSTVQEEGRKEHKEKRDHLIAELEELERQLDQQLIGKVRDLKAAYHAISKRIMDVLTDHSDEDQVKRYNLEAIESLQTLHTAFSRNKKAYRFGRVDEIASVLGAWNLSDLTTQTNVYYQYVYREIFENLDSDQKPILTEAVLNMEKKKVS